MNNIVENYFLDFPREYSLQVRWDADVKFSLDIT